MSRNINLRKPKLHRSVAALSFLVNIRPRCLTGPSLLTSRRWISARRHLPRITPFSQDDIYASQHLRRARPTFQAPERIPLSFSTDTRRHLQPQALQVCHLGALTISVRHQAKLFRYSITGTLSTPGCSEPTIAAAGITTEQLFPVVFEEEFIFKSINVPIQRSRDW